MTPKGLERLKADEGCKLSAYDDATGTAIIPGSAVRGWPTIGYGRNLASAGVRQSEAQAMLTNDVNDNQADLMRMFPWFAALAPVRQDVLENMAYNEGEGPDGLRSFTKMLAHLAAGEWDGAADEILNSDAARALPARYGRLADAMRSAIWASAAANIGGS